MAFRNFRFNCSMRAVALIATTVLTLYLLARTNLTATTVVVGLTLVLQVWGLIRYVERSNRDLSRFLLSIRHADFSQTFGAHGRGGSHEELRQTFNAVLDDFKRTRRDKQEHVRYLQTVVHHIGVGLIAYRQDGSIDLINTAAKRLLGVTRLRNLTELAAAHSDLAARLQLLASGEKVVYKLTGPNETSQLSLAATGFKLRGQHIKLVSMQNISAELAEQEMEAWQQLVRVLTHEIMNSVTPIASLSATVGELLREPPDGVSTSADALLNADTLEDVRTAVATIEKRSEGLTHFVEAYRNLTRIPQPQFQIVAVGDLIDRTMRLIRARDDIRGLTFITQVDPATLELTADPDLVEQVLLNLTINAVQALRDKADGTIAVSARLGDRGQVLIHVEDNGPGIPATACDRLFVPFYTTKPQGSGIGLSLSRQIMRLHKGDITVTSVPDQSTVFTLRF
ncbi:MAG: PAS domain-containing protein [candidate division Zixibacteria bacterium]|nr:PAS domain-containing protein [candidate division Zixibacteria bacterium]